MLREDFYYLISTKDDLTLKDFENLKLGIHALKGVGVTEDASNKNRFSLFFDNHEFKPEFEFGNFTLPKTNKEASCIKVTFDAIDTSTPSLLKAVLAKSPLRIYSKKLDTLLPASENIDDATFFDFKPEFSEVYKKIGMSIIFNIFRTTIYYTKKENEDSIYLLNSNLIEYFAKTKQFEETPELCYKVANNIEEFVSKYDVGLIPTNFYEFYGKSFKIVNRSNFDIENPGRKVFIKPYIFELNKADSMFHTLPGAKGSLLYMTKIQKGETLDIALKRFLLEDLKVTDDYIGAYVGPIIDFDRDKENKLTPRLVVSVYVGEGVLPQQVREEANRSWNSIEK